MSIFLRLHPTTTPHATSHDYNSGLNAIHVTSISQHALDLVSISGACLHADFYGSTDSTQKGLQMHMADPPWNSLDRHGGGLALCAHRSHTMSATSIRYKVCYLQIFMQEMQYVN